MLAVGRQPPLHDPAEQAHHHAEERALQPRAGVAASLHVATIPHRASDVKATAKDTLLFAERGQEEQAVRFLCRYVASRAPSLVGHPWTFLVALGVVLAWVASGPLFGWSGGWVLWPATVTSVGAFLLVLLLQYSQNRDTRAIQLKLDELIRSLGEARTQLVRLEELSDEELTEIEAEFEALRDEEPAPAKER